MNNSPKNLDFGYSPRNASHHTNKMSWRRQDGSYPKQGYASAGGYLAQCINDLVRNGTGARKAIIGGVEYITVHLSGGAELWWCPTSRELYALRPNGPLQGSESPTFEKHIKGAGLRCSKAEGATIAEGDLNQWHGVKWVITTDDMPPAATPSEDEDDKPEQASLL